MIAIRDPRRAGLNIRLAVVLVAVRASTAFAQSAAPDKGNDRAAAQSLFDAAKSLMSAGRFDEACPKLAESQRLDPAGGTLLNMALCYEGEGRLATAWADYKQALAIARRDGRADRVRAAQERIAALEPRLPRITITNSAGATAIALDDRAVGSVEWGTPIPVDPGAHDVKAERAGAPPWDARVTLGPAERTIVDVPALASIAPVDVAIVNVEERAASGPASQRNRRIAAYALAGTTLAAVGVGTFFGLRAISKHHPNDPRCPTNDTCTLAGKQDNDDARTAALVSDVAFAGAVLAAGLTTYLWYSSRAAAAVDAQKTVFAPAVGADYAALQVTGTW